jgi:hypothetical protein
MTSKEFIEREYLSAGREKSFSSIYKDSAGNIYSYGPHYPLLFRVDGIDYINVTGYSSTTAKHISWARSVEPDAVPVVLRRGDRLPLTTDDLLERLSEQREEIAIQMRQKVRKNTAVYKDLFRQLMRVDRNRQLIRG